MDGFGYVGIKKCYWLCMCIQQFSNLNRLYSYKCIQRIIIHLNSYVILLKQMDLCLVLCLWVYVGFKYLFIHMFFLWFCGSIVEQCWENHWGKNALECNEIHLHAYQHVWTFFFIHQKIRIWHLSLISLFIWDAWWNTMVLKHYTLLQLFSIKKKL